MARYQITLDGKNIRRKTVDKIAKELLAKYTPENPKDMAGAAAATISVTEANLPKTRGERFNQAIAKVTEAKEEIDSLNEELTDWRNGLPENQQEGEKAGELDEAIEALDQINESLKDAVEQDVSFPRAY